MMATELEKYQNVLKEAAALKNTNTMFGRSADEYNANRFGIQDRTPLSDYFNQLAIEDEASRILADPGLLQQFMEDNNIDGDQSGVSTSNTTIGIGNATDTITQDAVIAGILGLFTGGVPGAIQGGVKSYITDTLAILDQVNNTRDPIQALNALQGWTDTRAPALVVSGKTNYNTPYDSSKDGRINPAPVVSGKDNYNTYGDSVSNTPDSFTGADVSYGDPSYGSLF